MATDPVGTFSGLASGIQWRDLVDQLMKVERRPAALLEQRITGIQTRTAAWLTVQNKLTAFQSAARGLADGSALHKYTTAISGSGFNASASSDASPGSYSVEVLRLAAAEKVGGDVVASSSSALGYSGEFWINGHRISVNTSDTLSDVAYAINAANTGSNATGVSAAVVSASSGYQLVLSSQRTGAAGINIADGADGIATSLGFTDATTAIKHATSDGAKSDAFTSQATAVSTLLELTGATRSGLVTLGTGGSAVQVTVDLDQSLTQIAQAINGAAPGITASVVTDTTGGTTTYRLDISGTTAFSDPTGVLGALGVLEGGRGAVAQQLTAGTAFQDALGATATGATNLVDLRVAGTPAGALIGDTFTVSGTRADGTTFTQTLTIADPANPAAGTVKTLDDVLTALNGASGLNGTATAQIVNGQLVVTDATGGSSQLALSVVTHNEGGGSLNFGELTTTTVGRSREIVAGTDSAARVDGVYLTSSNNTITEAIPGVTLSLTAVSGSAGVLTVDRNTEAVVASVKGLVDAYNDIASFVTGQFTGGEGSNKPLAGDATLRGIYTSLRTTMQAVLTTGVGGSWTRLGDLGITIQKDGLFQFDSSTFRSALASDPTAVERLFGLSGSTTGAGVRYAAATDATVAGTYTVAVTSPATVASVTGSTNLGDGFGVANDTLTITDLETSSSYAVALVLGQSAATVLANVQAELATPKAHTVASATALQDDTLGFATSATTWDKIFQGGSAAGVLAGDEITVSGRRADGTSFYRTLSITDTATQTLGELKDLIQNAVGVGSNVSLTDGKFVVTADSAGSSVLEVNVSATLATGTLDLSTQVTQQGRDAAAIAASLVGGALRLTHEHYGSAAGFRIEYVNAATDTELGLGASGTEVRGTDVQGTLGGKAATGSGQRLTGDAGTDVEGLAVTVDSGFTTGSVTFSRGIASMLSVLLDPLVGTDSGSVQSVMDGLDERVTSLQTHIADIDARLAGRRTALIRQFTAMEQAMAKAQDQSAWLSSQIGALARWYSSANG